jgi:hypothetical protein
MKFLQRGFLLALITSLLVFAGSAQATCELVPIKQENFAGLELIRACSILPDAIPGLCDSFPPLSEPAEPLVDLVAENMLYFNWEIPAQNVALLEDIFGLAARGFNIVPIEIIKGEKPKYYLSLNFYSVVIAGVVNVRSEWSIYVATAGDPKPRYMVIEILSNEAAADPTFINIDPQLPPQQWFLKPGTAVSYSISDTEVEVSNPDFLANFSLQPGLGQKNASPPATGKYVEVGQPWAEANDVLYYVNGVADKALYNSNLTQAKLLSINPNKVQINNSSPWSGFVGDKPDNVLLYRQPLKLAFTPYFNLYDPAIGLDPGYVGALQLFKNITFGGFSYGHAFQVLFGQAEPLLRFNVPNDRVPSIFVNFNIPRKNVGAFESALDLPPGFKLARSRVTQGRPLQYLLSLNIYETINVLTGQPENRAEWSVYVEDESDPTATRPYLMVVDVKSSAPSLDPANLFTPPVGFVYTKSNDLVTASIADYDSSGYFDIVFSMPDATAPSVPLQAEWILSNDRVYWGNGVYDKLLYNGLLLDADVADANLASVVIDDSSIWSGFVDPEPVQVAVFRNPLQFVVRPWYNVEELCAAQ